mmetsp:Transcript_108617/g.307152  ORF Transcript_108617/g.307152 Transcript_108617/m.307152 type:complete len:244 (-) Transcript_108617:770-1501(-)
MSPSMAWTPTMPSIARASRYTSPFCWPSLRACSITFREVVYSSFWTSMRASACMCEKASSSKPRKSLDRSTDSSMACFAFSHWPAPWCTSATRLRALHTQRRSTMFLQSVTASSAATRAWSKSPAATCAFAACCRAQKFSLLSPCSLAALRPSAAMSRASSTRLLLMWPSRTQPLAAASPAGSPSSLKSASASSAAARPARWSSLSVMYHSAREFRAFPCSFLSPVPRQSFSAFIFECMPSSR